MEIFDADHFEIDPSQERELAARGWSVLRRDPLAIVHADGFASGLAARLLCARLLSTSLPEGPAGAADFQRLSAVSDEIQRIVAACATLGAGDSTPDNYQAWEVAYGLVFSDVLSKRAHALLDGLGTSLRYCDPDASYREDVEAFAEALKDKVEGIRVLFAR